MSQRAIEEFTRFVVESPVEVDPGVTLQPGRYSGRKSFTVQVGRSDYTESTAEYDLELTSDELKRCGCEISDQLLSETIRITHHIEAGEIKA